MNNELKKYITQNIKYKYKNFDKGHDISHYNFVTKNCVNYAKKLNEKGEKIDLDIAYIVGAYHDIGITIERENHAKHSARIVLEDQMLKKFYDEATIKLISEAVEDHSSHLAYEPRNIYGKLVADADRNNSMYLVFSRPVKFRLKYSENKSREFIISDTYDFVQNKFGRNGYVKYWLPIEDTIKEQQEVWDLLDNKEKCLMYIAGIYDECVLSKIK